jgi:hypothetical protein
MDYAAGKGSGEASDLDSQSSNEDEIFGDDLQDASV